MKKRMVRVLTSAALTAAMVMSMGMTAFAEGEKPTTPITNIDIAKTLTSDGNTFAPNTVFRFTVREGNGGDFYDGQSTVTALPGEVDGLKVSSSFEGIEFTPGETVMSKTETKTGDDALVVDASKFSDTGIYHYIVEETAGDYDGIIYDQKDVNVYLYVYENEDGALYVGSVAINKEDETGKATNINFVNTYGADPEKPEEVDKVHDITIEKQVTGTFGETNKDFNFKIKVVGVAGEKYKAVKTDKEGATTETVILHDTETDVKLKDTETIQIFGLSENDLINVMETGAKEDGYIVSYVTDTGAEVDANFMENARVDKDNTKIIFKNHKDAVTPTGIVMTFAPYIALIALAGVFAVTFLRKRREEF